MHFIRQPQPDNTLLDRLGQLRTQIRQCGQEFRQVNDHSGSLFHPQYGYVVGYNVEAVEALLDEFEQGLEDCPNITTFDTQSQQLQAMARTIEADYEDSEVCNFAERVENYLHAHERDVTTYRQGFLGNAG